MLEGSLNQYNFFLKNSGLNKTIESLVREQLTKKSRVVVLDVGCGNALALKELKLIFKEKIQTIGLDVNDFSKENSDEKILNGFLESDLTSFSSSIDLLFFMRSFHLIGENQQAVEKILNLLSLNGKAVVLARITEVKEGELKFAGVQSKEDIDYLNELSGNKSIKFQGEKFSLKTKKRFLNASDLVDEGELNELGDYKLLFGLSMVIEKIK